MGTRPNGMARTPGEREHDNLRAALSRLIERGEPELGVRLAGALRWFWHGQGHYSEGRRWLEEALSKDNRASVVARVSVAAVAVASARPVVVPVQEPGQAPASYRPLPSIPGWRTVRRPAGNVA